MIEGEAAPDRYLLQLWPSPRRADIVVRQTSEAAAYWHSEARNLPPAPSAEDSRSQRSLIDSYGGESWVALVVRWDEGPQPALRIQRPSFAVPTIVSASVPDPLRAVVDGSSTVRRRPEPQSSPWLHRGAIRCRDGFLKVDP